MELKSKRSFIALITIALLLILAACGKSAEERWQEQYDLGQKYLSELDYEQALLAFSKAIEIDEKQVDAYLGRAQVYLQQENYEAVIADYTSALAIDADQSELYILRGDAYAELASEADEPAKRDSLNRAGSDYEQAIDKMGLTWELFIKLSDIYKQTDESKLSDLIEKALENFGDTDELANWLQSNGYYLTDSGNVETIDLGEYLGQFNYNHMEENGVVYHGRGSAYDYFVEKEKRLQILAPIDLVVQAAIEAESEDIITYGEQLAAMYYMAGELETAKEICAILYKNSGNEIYNPEDHMLYGTDNGMSTSYCNGYGCITSKDEPSLGTTYSYTYDESGRMKSQVQRSEYGHADTIYEYDAMGRISSYTYSFADANYYETHIFEYNGNTVTAKMRASDLSEYSIMSVYYIDGYGFIENVDSSATD